MSTLYEEPEDDEQDLRQATLHEITTCPECRGRCEDRNGDPCENCFGEGEL